MKPSLSRNILTWHKHTHTFTHTQNTAQIINSATIDACGKGQQWITATTLLREMQQWHMKPSTITYNAAISACEKGQQWISATTLLREMQQWHMKTDTITYSAAISACEKGQQWMTATTLLRQMQQWHVADMLTYIIAAAICRFGENTNLKINFRLGVGPLTMILFLGVIFGPCALMKKCMCKQKLI